MNASLHSINDAGLDWADNVVDTTVQQMGQEPKGLLFKPIPQSELKAIRQCSPHETHKGCCRNLKGRRQRLVRSQSGYPGSHAPSPAFSASAAIGSYYERQYSVYFTIGLDFLTEDI